MTDPAETAREQLDLGWSSSFPAAAGRTVLARYPPDTFDIDGWVLREKGAARPAAWLSPWDRETWVALGVTGDECWRLMPLGRRHPDFGAVDRDDRLAAVCRRPFGRAQRIEIAGAQMRLKPPLSPFHGPWRLSDGDGDVARVQVVRKTVELIFAWERRPPLAALVSLLVTYVLIIEHLTAVPMSSGAGGG